MPTDPDTPADGENQHPQDGNVPENNQQNANTSSAAPQPNASGNTIDKVEAPGGAVFQGQTINFIAHSLDLGTFRSILGSFPGGALPPTGESGTVTEAFRIAKEANSLPGAESTDEDTGPAQQPDHLPDTEDEIAHWYCDDLRESERRFVQAVAVFHGAPMHSVTKAAGELYIPVRERTRKDDRNRGPRTEETPRSTHDLLERTYTERRTVSGASRVFWVDVQRNGYSAFGMRVLRFIADEAAGVASLTGSTVLSTLQKWATQGESELTWRAARALGVIWWRLDQNHLRETARAWATSKNTRIAQSSAGLLDGAYETERAESTMESDTPAQSSIVRLLRDWSDEALRATDGDSAELNMQLNMQLVRTVASTYSLIGRSWPEVALDGLDYALELAPNQAKRDYVSLSLASFAFVSMSYVTLAWAGLVREVFARLAQQLKRLALEQMEIRSTSTMASTSLRREEGLAALFFVFFLVSVASLSGDDEEHTSAYSKEYRLPLRPTIPSAQSRDVLLAAILGEAEDQLRDDTTTILCAAIMQSQDQLAFDVMRGWAEIVLRQAGDQAEALRSSYLAFVVGVGERVMQWDRELGHTGLRTRMTVFRNRVRQWASALRLSGLGPPAHAHSTREPSPSELLAQFALDVQAQLGV